MGPQVNNRKPSGVPSGVVAPGYDVTCTITCITSITLRSGSPRSSDSARTVQFYGLLFPKSRMNANIFLDHSSVITKNAIYHFQSVSNFLTFDFFLKLFILKSTITVKKILIFGPHRGRLETLVRVTPARKVNLFKYFITSSAYFDHLGCFISWLRFWFRRLLLSNFIPIIKFSSQNNFIDFSLVISNITSHKEFSHNGFKKKVKTIENGLKTLSWQFHNLSYLTLA